MWAVSLAVCAGVLTPAQAHGEPTHSDAEPTIVSVDFCADQFVLALTNKDQTLALSKDATSLFSFYRERAKDIPLTRGSAEEVLLYNPDVAVRQWFGSTATDTLFARAGIKSIPIGFAATLEATFTNLISLGQQINRAPEARAFVEKRRAMLKALESTPSITAKALYVTPGGFSAGKGTFVDDIIHLSGFATMADDYGQAGWGPLPLEAIIQKPPQVIITSFYDLSSERSRWSASNHPVIKDMLNDLPVIDVPSRYLSCSGMFATDAAQFIRTQARQIGLTHD